MYTQDFDETMPFWGDSFAAGPYIIYVLDPYIEVQNKTSNNRQGYLAVPVATQRWRPHRRQCLWLQLHHSGLCDVQHERLPVEI